MEKKGGLTRKEQIERDKQEIERLQNRIKQNESKEKEKARKARTKRLIELGAIVESRLSENAVAVLRVMPRHKLKAINDWLAKQYFQIDTLKKELAAEEEAEKQKKKKPSNNDGNEKENNF